jgi:acyl-CoA synthetase (AMP-forming)/AMP-acid ligase II
MTGRSLLAWLREPASERGIHFRQDDGSAVFHSYRELASRVGQMADALLGAGLRRAQTVAIVEQASPDFVAAFFAALWIGAVPAPLPPPLKLQPAVPYRAQLERLLAVVRPSLLLTSDDYAALLGAGATTFAALPRGPRAALAPGPDALLQFTSGSSGAPKGLRLSHAAVQANLHAIHRWLKGPEQRAVGSWLPVHHDMGLVGCLLWPIVYGLDLWSMTPAQFVRAPASYLRCFEHATIGALPPFAIDYLLARSATADLQGLDLSGCTGLVVGAERISAQSLRAFLSAFAPFGLRSSALLPAYGMAEACCAVAGVPLRTEFECLRVTSSSTHLGHGVLPADEGPSLDVICCGRALDGTGLQVVDDHGRPVPEGVVGEIVVRSPALAAQLPRRSPPAAHSTGDAGFLRAGKLFVLGRLGDGLKVRGDMVFAEDLELSLCELGCSRWSTVVLLGSHAGRETALVLLEQPDPRLLPLAAKLLSSRLSGADVRVLPCARGSIQRTSSGKPMRRALWKQYVVNSKPDHPNCTTTQR